MVATGAARAARARAGTGAGAGTGLTAMNVFAVKAKSMVWRGRENIGHALLSCLRAAAAAQAA
eukprot:13120848-Alexandrium_andersonii.AAC.1